MGMSRFTDEQMVAILREVERTSGADAAKKSKVSDQTIYAWRKHVGQMESADVKRRPDSLIHSPGVREIQASRSQSPACKPAYWMASPKLRFSLDYAMLSSGCSLATLGNLSAASSKRSRFITLVHAATKSFANFSFASAHA